MARLARLIIPGQVHHVVQRGNNGQPIFLRPQDYETMLELLHAQLQKLDIAVHAYVLTPNQFQLLLTPHGESSLQQLLQGLGRSYVRYFNQAHGRTGTLWDGRYRSTVLQAERYLLPCMVYMDLQPVRLGLVHQADAYAWSSHGHYIGRRVDRLVQPHALLWDMGNTPFAREASYQAQVNAADDALARAVLASATQKGWALGDPAFLATMQKETPRRVAPLPAGRPRNKPESGVA